MAVTLALPATPVRMRVLLWLLSGAILTAMSVLFADQPIATWSHDVLRRPRLAVDITLVAGVVYLGGACLLVLLAALISRIAGHRMGFLWRSAIAAASATLLATLAIIFLKFGCGRLWPETWIDNNPSWIRDHAYGFVPFHGGEGYGSFPSGHTARVTAPFAVLWHRLPRLRWIWAMPTVVMSAALIAANFHFLGDCIAGAYVGVACAACVLWLVR
jgi:membrane-associated phospholipid phosphatase